MVARINGEVAIEAPDVNKLKLLRSLQLLQWSNADAVAKAAMDIFLKADTETSLAATALLNRDAIAKEPAAKARLDELLKPVIGKPAFVDLVQRLSLTGFEKELLDYILANPAAEESVTAGRLIAMNRDGTADLLAKSDPKDARAIAGVLGRVSDRASVAVLGTAFWKVKDNGVRAAMIEALALSGEGGRNILKWHKEGKLPPDLQAGAALALSRSTDAGLRGQASVELPVPAALGAEKFPPLPELMKLAGDAAKGQTAFMAAGCVGCHQVKGQFVNFGPDLSVIGNKLSKDGLFTAVLYPSAAVEHSYNGVTLSTKAGAQVVGYIISDTAEELTLKIAGGAQQSVKKADITKREDMKLSLMPPGLAAGIGPQGLADLVAWLQTLK
jgi:putative heme-binding domain-containing protein